MSKKETFLTSKRDKSFLGLFRVITSFTTYKRPSKVNIDYYKQGTVDILSCLVGIFFVLKNSEACITKDCGGLTPASN